MHRAAFGTRASASTHATPAANTLAGRGEYHMWTPDAIAALQAAVVSGEYEHYKLYAQLVNGRPASALRDLLGLKAAGKPIPIEEVESLEAVLARFDGAGMSLGALARGA